jgi:hypothetical protein
MTNIYCSWDIIGRDGKQVVSMSARWSHAKACLYAGHEVLRVSFYRVVPDIGEDETEADNAERVETLSDCMQCGQFREHGHKCGGKS